MAKIQNPTKVITGVNTRWSYANVWDAKSINGGAPKYSVSLIIPKSDTVTVNKIKAAIEAAYEEGQSKLKGNGKTVPALTILKTPLRDGDLERPDDPAYANPFNTNCRRLSFTKSLRPVNSLNLNGLLPFSSSFVIPKVFPYCVIKSTAYNISNV